MPRILITLNSLVIRTLLFRTKHGQEAATLANSNTQMKLYINFLIFLSAASFCNAQQSAPAPIPCNQRFVLYTVNETEVGQSRAFAVVYRIDTLTGETWRMEKIQTKMKDGTLLNLEGWKRIPEKDPYLAAAELTRPELFSDQKKN